MEIVDSRGQVRFINENPGTRCTEPNATTPVQTNDHCKTNARQYKLTFMQQHYHTESTSNYTNTQTTACIAKLTPSLLDKLVPCKNCNLSGVLLHHAWNSSCCASVNSGHPFGIFGHQAFSNTTSFFYGGV